MQAPAQQGFDQARLYMWVKGLESKVNILLREVDVLKNDFTKKHGTLKKELATANDDLLELKHAVQKTEQKIDLIIKELRQTAGKEDVLTMKKYLDLWNPLHFATQRDVERLVKDALEKHHARGAMRSENHPSSTPHLPHPHHKHHSHQHEQ